jgi:hypothetical protein
VKSAFSVAVLKGNKIVVLKVLFWIWLLFTILYGGFGLILFSLQSKFIYCPIRKISLTPQEIGLKFEDVFFNTSDNIKLNGWYIPADKAEFTVLFFHGNGGNIMHRLDSIQQLNQLGLNCFIIDYRGYGKSSGKTTEFGTYLDAKAAYDWLINEKNIDPANIIIFGRSLGGSIASELAVRIDCAALIIESTFTSYVDMGRKFYPYMPVKYFARYKYLTIEHVKKLTVPIMIIHSPDDDIIPFEFGKKLYEAASEPKEFVEITGSHNDGFLTSGRIYTDAWQNWISFLKDRKKQISHQAS